MSTASDHVCRKSVAIFVPSMRGGGAERVMATVANQLARVGWQVDLLLTKAEGPYLAELSREVCVVDFNRERTLHSLLPLVRYLRHRKPSSMLSALGHANLIAILARILSRTSTRTVVSERGAPTVDSDGRETPHLLRLLRRLLYPKADAVIAVSDGVADELALQIGLDRSRIHTVYNPVDLDEIESASNETVDHPWLRAGTENVLISVGRLTPVKGVDTLLDAFAMVTRDISAKLILLGDGPLRTQLELKTDALGISECVDFVGFQENPFSWMSRADLFVLSSRSEGLPNALLQAMACGLKIVSTDCRYGPSEILEGGKWGRLVPPNNATALAEAILVALGDTSRVNTRDRASFFSVKNSVTRYAEILEDVAR